MTHNFACVGCIRGLLGAAAVMLIATAGALAQPKDAPAPKQAVQPKTDKPADAPKPKEDPKVSPYVLDFKVKPLDGKEQDLSAYKGKVVVIVNVASQCG